METQKVKTCSFRERVSDSYIYDGRAIMNTRAQCLQIRMLVIVAEVRMRPKGPKATFIFRGRGEIVIMPVGTRSCSPSVSKRTNYLRSKELHYNMTSFLTSFPTDPHWLV